MRPAFAFLLTAAMCATADAQDAATPPSASRANGTNAPAAATVAPAGDPSAPCNSDTECVVAMAPAASERAGGPCCASCDVYQARSTRASAPAACDAARRGACRVHCAAISPAAPGAACVRGRCVLAYPRLDDRCAQDQDCVTVPALETSAASGACRVACGRVVPANRRDAQWVQGLWRNASVGGVCPADCFTELQPPARCQGGRCVGPSVVAVRIASASFRSPWTNGSLSPGAILAVAERSVPALRQCSEPPRTMSVPGTWSFGLEFERAPSGELTEVHAVGMVASFPHLAVCVENVLRTWAFPATDASAATRIQLLMDLTFETTP